MIAALTHPDIMDSMAHEATCARVAREVMRDADARLVDAVLRNRPARERRALEEHAARARARLLSLNAGVVA